MKHILGIIKSIIHQNGTLEIDVLKNILVCPAIILVLWLDCITSIQFKEKFHIYWYTRVDLTSWYFIYSPGPLIRSILNCTFISRCVFYSMLVNAHCTYMDAMNWNGITTTTRWSNNTTFLLPMGTLYIPIYIRKIQRERYWIFLTDTWRIYRQQIISQRIDEKFNSSSNYPRSVLLLISHYVKMSINVDK